MFGSAATTAQQPPAGTGLFGFTSAPPPQPSTGLFGQPAPAVPVIATTVNTTALSSTPSRGLGGIAPSSANNIAAPSDSTVVQKPRDTQLPQPLMSAVTDFKQLLKKNQETSDSICGDLFDQVRVTEKIDTVKSAISTSSSQIARVVEAARILRNSVHVIISKAEVLHRSKDTSRGAYSLHTESTEFSRFMNDRIIEYEKEYLQCEMRLAQLCKQLSGQSNNFVQCVSSTEAVGAIASIQAQLQNILPEIYATHESIERLRDYQRHGQKPLDDSQLDRVGPNPFSMSNTPYYGLMNPSQPQHQVNTAPNANAFFTQATVPAALSVQNKPLFGAIPSSGVGQSTGLFSTPLRPPAASTSSFLTRPLSLGATLSSPSSGLLFSGGATKPIGTATAFAQTTQDDLTHKRSRQ